MTRHNDSIDFDSIEITDDLMFSTVFQDPQLCKGLVEVLLGIEVDSVKLVEEQEPLGAGPLSRAGVVDVLVRDAEGNAFDLEMQNHVAKSLPYRARRYLSLVDVMTLDRGKKFDEARGAVVVFICPLDPFKRGWKRYNFPRVCTQDGIALEDGTDIVFINAGGTKGDVGPEFDAFTHYLLDHNDVESAYVRTVDDAVRSWRNNHLWRRYRVLWSEKYRDEFVDARRKGHEDGYSEGHDEGYSEGHEQGRAEGREQGRAEGRELGRQEELDRLSQLAKQLDVQGRGAELLGAMQDEGLLKKLLKEFDLA